MPGGDGAVKRVADVDASEDNCRSRRFHFENYQVKSEEHVGEADEDLQINR